MTRTLALLVVTVLALAGCGQTDEVAPASAASAGAQGDGLVAIATVYPLAWLSEQIAPGAELTYLGAGGQDPHDLELSPGDRETLDGADVVLFMGDIGFQPQVEEAIAGASGAVVAAADVVGEDALLPISHGAEDHAGEDDHASETEHADEDDHGHESEHADEDDHADEGDHAHESEHADETDHADGGDHAGEDDHAHGEVDPHLWFDAARWAEVAVATGEAFAEADPDRAEVYTDAAATVAADLEALAEEIGATLADCTHDEVVVGHEAYAYLLEPNGLHQEGVSGAGGHADASPQRIAELSEEVSDEGIPAVLAEPVEGRTDAEAVAAEAGVEVVEILSLDIVTDEQYAQGYPDLLRAQAAAVAQAADCQS